MTNTKKISLLAGGIAFVALLVFLGFWYKGQQKAAFNAGVDKAYAGMTPSSQGSYGENVSAFFHRMTTPNAKVSQADLERLALLCSDSNLFHRSHAINTLSYLKTPEASKITVEQAQRQLKDVEGMVRLSALSALRRVNAPNLRSIAEQMKSDSFHQVHQMAEKILSAN